MTMGTAATMMGIAEAVGLALPGASSSIPAVDANHIAHEPPSAAGASSHMVWEDLTPARMLTRAQNFENAIACAMAMGCSTNAIIHLVAMSRRAGHPVSLDDFDAFSRQRARDRQHPTQRRPLPDGGLLLRGRRPARPAGTHGRPHLDTAAMTVNGKTLGENIAVQPGPPGRRDPPAVQPHLRRRARWPCCAATWRPDGVVIKPSACAPHLLRHTGRALVFDDYPSLKQAVDDPHLDVNGEDILVLRNAGPKGAGMPEWGMLPIPTKLLKQGVKDMLRLSDARMSGTSYGGCLLHCSPESAVGGPLALVRTGDRITVDVPARRIHLEVSDSELATRRAAWTPPPARYERGYGWLFGRHILQANEGCDFDFLETGFGRAVPEPDIF